jgi:hypothetical protein
MGKVRILIAAAALIGASSSAAWLPARAQAPRFKPANLEVFDARRLVVELPGHLFEYGKELQLNFKPAAFPAQPRPRLAVRLFRLGPSAARPGALKEIDDCFVYRSWVRTYPAYGAISLIRLNGLHALTVANGRVTNGRFIVMFERDSNPQPFIRIRKADVASYFDRGLRVEVRAPATSFSPAAITEYSRNAALTYQELAEARAIQNRPCFNIRLASADNGMPLLLGLCVSPLKRPDPPA